MNYNKEKWTNSSPLEYWNNNEKAKRCANEKMQDFITAVFTEVSEKGIDKTISKKNIKRIYDKYCG